MGDTYTRRLQIHKAWIFMEALAVTAGIAMGQSRTTTSVTATNPYGEFPRVETALDFMYIHTGAILGFQSGLNCVGGGGTIAYSLTSALAVAADLGGCRILELDGATGPLSKIHGSEFTYLFGPRITFRNSTRFDPFGELSFGGTRASISCNNGDFGNNCGSLTASQLPTRTVANPFGTSVSKNAFSLSVGGGFDFKLGHNIALRLVQAEYLYTRFGNDCPFAICSNNNSQNSFRLKSGIVMSWGGGGAH
ncbi:MAG TPA: outer membrane beta-barrel protein [Granulicella sp.]|jgi:opacity protein-like surface antigen|nr:outer membrane beta-barrel protein [Granulicella sp.]